MNRRGFLGTLVGGLAASAAVRTWPFRVYSFPSEITIEKPLAVRLVREFDPARNTMVTRWDILAGWVKLDARPSDFRLIGISA